MVPSFLYFVSFYFFSSICFFFCSLSFSHFVFVGVFFVCVVPSFVFFCPGSGTVDTESSHSLLPFVLGYYAFLFLFFLGQKFIQPNFFQNVFLPCLHYVFNLLEIHPNSGKHEAEGTVSCPPASGTCSPFCLTCTSESVALVLTWPLSFLPFRTWGLACLWQQVHQLRTLRTSLGSHFASFLRPCSLPKPTCHDCRFPYLHPCLCSSSVRTPVGTSGPLEQMCQHHRQD